MQMGSNSILVHAEQHVGFMLTLSAAEEHTVVALSFVATKNSLPLDPK